MLGTLASYIHAWPWLLSTRWSLFLIPWGMHFLVFPHIWPNSHTGGRNSCVVLKVHTDRQDLHHWATTLKHVTFGLFFWSPKELATNRAATTTWHSLSDSNKRKEMYWLLHSLETGSPRSISAELWVSDTLLWPCFWVCGCGWVPSLCVHTRRFRDSVADTPHSKFRVP